VVAKVIEEKNMATQDQCCTIVPYFTVSDENRQEFLNGCEAFVEATQNEPGCLYYGFSVNGNEIHCREGYKDADALLAHLDNVGALLQEALKIAELSRFEIHGPESELEKLRGPLTDLNPKFFTLDCGFRR
jgi:quinol monooxygenase YgiN